MTYYLYVAKPNDTHSWDTKNGYVYRFLVVYKDGRKPGFVSWLDQEFKKSLSEEDYKNCWSWGNQGLKAETWFEADRLAKEVLGDLYGGFID